MAHEAKTIVGMLERVFSLVTDVEQVHKVLVAHGKLDAKSKLKEGSRLDLGKMDLDMSQLAEWIKADNAETATAPPTSEPSEAPAPAEAASTDDSALPPSAPEEVQPMDSPTFEGKVPTEEFPGFTLFDPSQLTAEEAEQQFRWVLSRRNMSFVPPAQLRPYDPYGYLYALFNSGSEVDVSAFEPFRPMKFEEEGQSLRYDSVVTGDRQADPSVKDYNSRLDSDNPLDVPATSFALTQLLVGCLKTMGLRSDRDGWIRVSINKMMLDPDPDPLTPFLDKELKSSRASAASRQVMREAAERRQAALTGPRTQLAEDVADERAREPRRMEDLDPAPADHRLLQQEVLTLIREGFTTMEQLPEMMAELIRRHPYATNDDIKAAMDPVRSRFEKEA